MIDFSFYLPTKIYFGEDKHLQIVDVLREFSYKNILIVCGNHTKISGLLDTISQLLDKNNIIYFELIYQRHDRASRHTGAAEAQLIRIDGEEKAVNIKYSIDVKLLCYKLCIAARDYYNKNKGKFDFFNYQIVGLDFNTKRNLGVSINETAFDYKNDNEELDIDILYQMACEF